MPETLQLVVEGVVAISTLVNLLPQLLIVHLEVLQLSLEPLELVLAHGVVLPG